MAGSTGVKPGTPLYSACIALLATVIDELRPRAVIALGKYPIRFLAEATDEPAVRPWGGPWRGFGQIDANHGAVVRGVRFPGCQEHKVTLVAMSHTSIPSNFTGRMHRGKEHRAACVAMLAELGRPPS
jgi:uracil-DNA glycosylase